MSSPTIDEALSVLFPLTVDSRLEVRGININRCQVGAVCDRNLLSSPTYQRLFTSSLTDVVQIAIVAFTNLLQCLTSSPTSIDARSGGFVTV